MPIAVASTIGPSGSGVSGSRDELLLVFAPHRQTSRTQTSIGHVRDRERSPEGLAARALPFRPRLGRRSLPATLTGSGRASDFADPYLDKNLQLPVLAFDDAVTYATLVLCFGDRGASEALERIAQIVAVRNLLPLLDCAHHSDESATQERLARQVCDGLRADRKVNPRQIKAS